MRRNGDEGVPGLCTHCKFLSRALRALTMGEHGLKSGMGITRRLTRELWARTADSATEDLFHLLEAGSLMAAT